MKVRFTAWLSEEERNGIHAQAKGMGASDNFIFRLAVRQWLGLATPNIQPTERGTSNAHADGKAS